MKPSTMKFIENILLLLVVLILKLAFLGAGCWMMYHGWYGCGITSVVFGALIRRPPETVAKNDAIIEGEIIEDEERGL